MLQLLRRMMNVILKRWFDGTNQISLFRPMDVREKAATKRSGGLPVYEGNETAQSKSYSSRRANDISLGIELDVRR